MSSRFLAFLFARYSPSDILAAAAPVGAPAGLSLADVNVSVQILGGCLGGAYLVWKWRREAKQPAPPTPPPAAHA